MAHSCLSHRREVQARTVIDPLQARPIQTQSSLGRGIDQSIEPAAQLRGHRSLISGVHPVRGPESSRGDGDLSQHVLGMVLEVRGVGDQRRGHRSVLSFLFRALQVPRLHPGRHRVLVDLLLRAAPAEEQHIGHHIRPGRVPHRVARQAHPSHQVPVPGELPPGSSPLGVHRPGRGHHRHIPARGGHPQRLGDEVVVD